MFLFSKTVTEKFLQKMILNLQQNRGRFWSERAEVLPVPCIIGPTVKCRTNKHESLTCKLSFTSLSKAAGDILGMEATVSDMNLPMLLSGATCPSW